MNPMNWKPSNPLSVDQDGTLEQAESSMPVRLIATFDELKTTTLETPVSQALRIANEGGFDYLPVRHEVHGPFIGLFDRSSYQSENQLGRVDGFDQDEAESKRDERAVILRRLLTSKRDTFETLELADRLFYACPRFVECFRKEDGDVFGVGSIRDGWAYSALACGFAV